MIKDYFKVAFRQLKKNKGFSFLNILGLSIGMACAMLILLWVSDEFGYNRFHKNYSRLYQVMENQTYDGKTFTFGALPGKFGPAVKEDLPEIEYSARADWGQRMLFSLGDKSIFERGYFTDPDFLKIFSFKILKGDTAGLFTDPTSIVITDKMAERFFEKGDALGKTLKINNDKPYTIKAIVKDPPFSSTLKFSWLASFKIYEDRNQWLQNWGNNGIQTFITLKKEADPVQVDKKLHDYIHSKDTSATAKFEEGKQAGGRIELINIFTLIGILIIVIACINFMNLATARSEQRAREVGVRKAIGAGRGMLIRQFFSESVLMAFFAMIIAALIIWLVLPLFNTIVEKQLSFDPSNPLIWGGLPLMALICGLLAGIYPSLYLSSFNPVAVFKGLRIGKNSGIVYVRKILVVVQFVISIVLIISTIIIYKQINHVKGRQLGYNKDNVLYTALRGDMTAHFPAIYNDLIATGVVENAAVSNNQVLNVGSSGGGFEWQGKNPKSELLVSMEWVSPQYISALGMQLKSGRNFYNDISSDSDNVIINETFAKIIGKENPVGDILRRDKDQLTIVGVVKDYVFNDMYKNPDPLIIFCDTSNVNQLAIRIKAGQDITKAVSKIEAVIKTNNPAYPFEYRFLDDDFNNLFKSESLMGKLSKIFAFLAILISCLGLFGLAAYTAERRTKEIGIRKVLGATISNVIALLSKDFLLLVAIASFIAFPVAWWLMYKFLQGFAYRISIHWWVFAIAGILAVIIALFTVSFQAIKAAIANPVKSLRTE
jgi:ABC-type antimicrobial peptide transport system permease subunit